MKKKIEKSNVRYSTTTYTARADEYDEKNKNSYKQVEVDKISTKAKSKGKKPMDREPESYNLIERTFDNFFRGVDKEINKIQAPEYNCSKEEIDYARDLFNELKTLVSDSQTNIGKKGCNISGAVIIECAYYLGREVMKLELTNLANQMPSGPNPEDKKPMRLKYGKMYHEKIIENYGKGMSERSTKDNPETAKNQAYQDANDILIKDIGKGRTQGTFDLWRDEYIERTKPKN